MEPAGRLTCDELLDHSYFTVFRDWFQPELEVGPIPVPCIGTRHTHSPSLQMLLAKDARKIARSKSRVMVCWDKH